MTSCYHPYWRHWNFSLDHYVLHAKPEVDQSVVRTNSSQVVLSTASSLQHRARYAHPPAWIISWSVDCTQHQVPEDYNINIFYKLCGLTFKRKAILTAPVIHLYINPRTNGFSSKEVGSSGIMSSDTYSEAAGFESSLKNRVSRGTSWLPSNLSRQVPGEYRVFRQKNLSK